VAAAVPARKIIEIAEVAIESAAQFPGQQSDYSQLRPLPKPKRLKQLLLGMKQGGRNCIHGGNSHVLTSHRIAFPEKVQRFVPRIKSITL
jgi:hypothetical protein